MPTTSRKSARKNPFTKMGCSPTPSLDNQDDPSSHQKTGNYKQKSSSNKQDIPPKKENKNNQHDLEKIITRENVALNQCHLFPTCIPFCNRNKLLTIFSKPAAYVSSPFMYSHDPKR